MPEIKIPSQRRGISTTQKFTAVGVAAAAGVAGLALSLTPDSTENTAQAKPVNHSAGISLTPTGFPDQQDSIKNQLANAEKRAVVQKDEQSKAAKALAAKNAAESRSGKAASRSTERSVPEAAPKQYADNLDGWIREAMDIMAANGIPGTYEGIHRNIMRESSGDPSAINNWDINAVNGAPSIGLLQVIKPTFDHYHVEGTKKDQYDPVANIVAACNYAADKYGSMDNVDSAY
ncbi:transglycosylase SLT domain-containing protein [Streptomyces sp. XM4193]|uniref:transglycosylase SLT domain-containing protein n=1 Tax=Streptomyces sp. XM4193 TaxID=2929782 RepID=UPI001FFAD107|nr:transglycosylase SLT domain-containing protein [Streptomyces sp. XM4193]MCK1796336.1 transglycosylase SLT domain-containing protein [Streptomyces sp. XM4193]